MSAEFVAITAAFRELPDDFVLDGEAVAHCSQGLPDFHGLGPFGGMPAPDLREQPSEPSNSRDAFWKSQRSQELNAVMEMTIRRDPRANEALEAYQKKYNVPSVSENQRALRQRALERGD